jgi:hypothetical protein
MAGGDFPPAILLFTRHYQVQLDPVRTGLSSRPLTAALSPRGEGGEEPRNQTVTGL